MSGDESPYEVFPAGHFAGETASWKIADAIVSEVRHPVGKSVPPHRHEAAYFSLLLEGTYAEWGADFNIVYEPYTVAFHAARTLHEDRMGAGGRFFSVELLSRWIAVIDELGGARAHVFEMHGGDAIWLLLRLYREFLARDAGGEPAVEGLLFELCGHVAKRSVEETEEPRWLADIDASVQQRYREPVDVQALATGVHVHPSHLCRAYRRFRGRTISDAVLGMRVQHVCRSLIESDDSLTAIALEAGFTDQSHMTRIFKRITGHSPGAHRRGERANPVQDRRTGTPLR